MEPAGSGATWTLARRVSIGQCESTRVDRIGRVEVISKVDRQRSDVRSIAWLDEDVACSIIDVPATGRAVAQLEVVTAILAQR
jgi:hypothetical protein